MSTSNKDHMYFVVFFFNTRERYASCIQYFICGPMRNWTNNVISVFMHIYIYSPNVSICSYIYSISNRLCKSSTVHYYLPMDR